MIFWFFPLPLRPNFLQFWLKPILVFPPCFMSLDIFQCLPVYSRCELQFVSYCCEKTVYISFILEKKKSFFPEGPSLAPLYPFSSSLLLFLSCLAGHSLPRLLLFLHSSFHFPTFSSSCVTHSVVSDSLRPHGP